LEHAAADYHLKVWLSVDFSHMVDDLPDTRSILRSRGEHEQDVGAPLRNLRENLIRRHTATAKVHFIPIRFGQVGHHLASQLFSFAGTTVQADRTTPRGLL